MRLEDEDNIKMALFLTGLGSILVMALLILGLWQVIQIVISVFSP